MDNKKFVELPKKTRKLPPRKHTNTVKHNNIDEYMMLYDYRTTEYYKTMRERKLDPILDIEVDEKHAFKFNQQWDAYTGERLGDDPFGPIYFKPISLVYYFYIHRLDGLWKNASVSDDGLIFEGFYDMLVGSGNDLNVVGRGSYTELYLFRLPILDCYLPKEHNKSHITMGPRLTDDEINEIDKLCHTKKMQEEYFTMFNAKCPSIKTIKSLYDSAISCDSVVPDLYAQKYSIPQHYFVDKLRNLK